ncbi:MAG TPA: sn-glycerol-3-phosphate ABC transporter ATP-binding protein UgpC [Acetobacteraceae bacterium]|nr:sn-glycerol-3-phosphate ABC transporter ATP-binding protein UgpC [Acetobacteraceae bacterium]
MATLELRELRKAFGPLEVVHGIDLEVADGEFVVLVGPSGCGKSTILRMIAGLEDATSGDIRIGGKLVNEREPKDRDVAMVFQDYALYPHLTVFKNIAIALEYRGAGKAEIRQKVEDTARLLDIAELLDRLPRHLSGGQRQRVAMGRAIVRNPQLFLFDEPLSNLDAKLRVQMRTEIRRLRERVATTGIYVTHDQVEAMTLADRIVVLDRGRIEQIGTPDEIYETPATTFVAGFIGAPPMNLLSARLESLGGTWSVAIGDGLRLPLPMRSGDGMPADLWCGFRPEDVRIATPAGDGAPVLPGTALAIEPLGPEALVTVGLAGQEIACRLPPRVVRARGDPVHLAIDLARLHFFDRATGRRLPAD